MPPSLGDKLRALKEEEERAQNDAVDFVKSLDPGALTRLMAALPVAMGMELRRLAHPGKIEIDQMGFVVSAFGVMLSRTVEEVRRQNGIGND